eukprot:SAG11_NODE_2039_length_3892_cov_1.839705_2_plen_437_part_00
MADADETKLQVRFVSKIEDDELVMPSNAFAVPERLTRQGLAEVVNGMLQLEEAQAFDFIINGEFLRCSLASFVKSRHLSTELTIRIVVVRPFRKPRPKPSPELDDWVGCVSPVVCGTEVVAGLYNGAVCVCDHHDDSDSSAMAIDAGSLQTCGLQHEAPVKSVDLVACAGGDAVEYFMVSASQDTTLKCWVRVPGGDSTCVGTCQGHADSVDCVRICRAHPWAQDLEDGWQVRFVSGSWDNSVKLWNASLPAAAERAALDGPSREILPAASLTGHTQAVTCLCWPTYDTLYSASHDHTIRIWDMQSASESRTIFGSKRAVTCLDHSEVAGRIVTGHADQYLRLWDPRAPETTLKNVLVGKGTAHSAAISGVAWCPGSQHRLVSCALDGELKFWDLRCSVPLSTVAAHADRALCVAWPKEQLVVSGGSDNRLVYHKC